MAFLKIIYNVGSETVSINRPCCLHSGRNACDRGKHHHTVREEVSTLRTPRKKTEDVQGSLDHTWETLPRLSFSWDIRKSLSGHPPWPSDNHQIWLCVLEFSWSERSKQQIYIYKTIKSGAGFYQLQAEFIAEKTYSSVSSLTPTVTYQQQESVF